MICPVCDQTGFAYLFVAQGLRIIRCNSCGCIAQAPTSLESVFEPEPPLVLPDSETESDAAARYLRVLSKRGLKTGTILVICGAGPRVNTKIFVAQAQTHGFQTEVLSAPVRTAAYDAAVMLHQLQTAQNPQDLLADVHAALRPGAPLLVTVPCVDSWPARFFGRQWTEWRPENRWYFAQSSIQSLLLRQGFAGVLLNPDRRLYTLRHIHHRAADCPPTALTRTISLAYRVLPPAREMRNRLAASGIVVTALRREPSSRPKCSIIVPAFNESRSFPAVIEGLLQKDLPGADREIIIVESNSTDGTRELAKQYAAHPDIRLVLQDRPRGKGHAVREGFRHAIGDVILIQDADLEYDLNDYDSLLSPILSHRALFVLGTRHGGDWKLRKFSKQPGLSAALNFGHIFFTGLMNVLYRQRMTDPFTMFKVFHRDCLFGLEFQCDRFDFDHELVIKLVRKGYVPLEIPVNYVSRSFRDGKKIRIFRDPPSWIWINLKLRFTRLFPKDLG